MTLPAPLLDDRRFQDLVDDAKRMVQRRCPEWTDHNVSDPGVTLIEAFAFMTDQLLYRLNRVPDRLYVKFLDLIGLRMLPATAARVPVTFWLSGPPTAPFTIPVGTQVSTAQGDRTGPVVFSTAHRLEIVPSTLAAAATQRADESEPADHTDAVEFDQPLGVFSSTPAPGDLLFLGLDVAVPGCAVRLDVEAQAEGVGGNPKRPPRVWEAYVDEAWVECDITADETGGLNRSGSLVVHVPDGHASAVVAGRSAGWLRARVTEPEEGQPPYSASPIVRGLVACTVGGTATAVHAEIVESEVLGTAEGVAGQRFGLLRSPVVTGVSEPIVETSSTDGWQEWTRVEDFADSGRDDRHYLLDGFAGELVLGPLVRQADGGVRHHGAVPAPESIVRIRRYAVGGGPEGNVPTGAITTLRAAIPFVTDVENRYPATGGTQGESLEEAMRRGPLLLRTRDRAVTAEDYEVLAREAAPEAARVHCVPADAAEVPAGTVKVLVVPAAPSERGRIALENLIPGDETLARIGDRIEQTKVAGVRVLLEPPRYRGVTVVARLIARPRTNAEQITTDALDALYRLLNPLPGGGPDGSGWPFGRPVQVGELFAELGRVRGVELVEDLRLFSADPITGQRGAEVQRLNLDKHSLVFSFEHQVRVEET
jgi:predicted phage baseplate assembly protein